MFSETLNKLRFEIIRKDKKAHSKSKIVVK